MMNIYFSNVPSLCHTALFGMLPCCAFGNDATAPHHFGSYPGARKRKPSILWRAYSIFLLLTIASVSFVNYIIMSSYLSIHDKTGNKYGNEAFRLPTRQDTVIPDTDFIRHRYCKDKSPCIALLSASRHEGIGSEIDQRTLKKRVGAQNQTNHKNRILVREGYCAIHGCDVIVDFNDYHKTRSMWLSDYGKHKVGQMPPHWNKVAALQRWLPHYDGILQMDMDSTWISFNDSVYDLFHDTSTIYTSGTPELILFKRGEVSQCVVDSWWYYGTSPGCRYFKYPQNHRYQTQNLDMPWFWYGMLHCAEVYGAGPFQCV